ncbi:MAG: hypothetical protein ABIH92_03860 [Nanoarchaeota archaeon]
MPFFVKMNRKAVIWTTVIYSLIFVAFLVGMMIYIWSHNSGANIWSDYYAKELTHLINLAGPNQTITLDVHKATEIAVDNGLRGFSEIFNFDNVNNEVCVKLSRGQKTCYKYFNEIEVVDRRIELAGDTTGEINILIIEIGEKKWNNG